MEPFMTVIEFAGISDFIGCDQKYENSYSEVLRFIRERMTFRVYTSVRDKFYLILVFVFIIPVGLSAQNAYIQGVVQDVDGTPLAGAVVMLMRDGTRVAATTCKINGTFKISAHILQTDVLQVSFVGFRNRQIPVSVLTDRNEIHIVLQESNIQLDDVIVMGPSISEDFAVERLESIDIYLSPASGADPLKAVSVMAASTNVSESANTELRGSSGNHSVVVLNGVPVWKPVRNTQLNGIGNFSVFNTELIGQMKVYAGNPPLTIGNSIAGAIEIETPEHITRNDLKLSLSLANAGILISKKISDKNFLQLYANHQFSAPYLWLNHTNTDFLKRFNTTDGGVNLHLQLTPRLKFNLYEYAIDEYYRADTEQYNYKDESKATSRRWFQVSGFTFAALQSGVVVELNNGIDLCKSGYRFGVMDGSTRENRLYTSLSAKYFIGNLGFQAGLTHQYTRVNFYGIFPKYFYNYSDEAEGVTADDKLYNRVWEGYFYCKYTPMRHLLFSGAVRKNIPEASQPDYISWQVAGRWNMNEKFSLLLSAGKYHTYNVPAYNSQNFALHSSRQYSVDLTSHIYDFDLKLSSYLKNENTRDYFAENGKEAVVERRLKGLEFSVARTIGRFSFAGSYTFIDSRVRLGKKSYRSANDMDYIIRTSIVWRTANQWNIGINFSARPGLYYTPVEYALNISDNVWFPLYGDYNSEQVTAYHSLDLTVNKIFPLNKGHLLAFFTITNMLDKSNRNYPVYSTDYKSVLGWEEYQRRLVYVGLQFNF